MAKDEYAHESHHMHNADHGMESPFCPGAHYEMPGKSEEGGAGMQHNYHFEDSSKGMEGFKGGQFEGSGGKPFDPKTEGRGGKPYQ
jgi:hypothetical protein